MTGTVVIGPITNAALNYNVQIVNGDDDYRAHVYEKRYFNGVLQTEHEEDFSAKGWQQQVNFFGWTARMVSFPLSISHRETNEGDMVFSDSYTNLSPTSVIDASDGVTRFIAYNVWRYEASTAHYFNLSTTATINLATGARTEMTSFSSNRQAGDGTVYTASPNVTLNPFDNSGQQPYTCFDWSFDEFSVTSCVQNERVWTGKHGFAFKDDAWVPQAVIIQ